MMDQPIGKAKSRTSPALEIARRKLTASGMSETLKATAAFLRGT